MDPTQNPAATPTGNAPAQPPETPQEPKPVTREDVMEMIDEVAKRFTQSITARDKNIKTEVANLKQTVEKLGIPVTPEITAKLIEQAEATVDQQSTRAPTDQEPGEIPGEGNPVYKLATAYYKTTGVEIKTSDPEWAGLQKVLDDPTITGFEDGMVKFQIALHQAVEAKKARTASQSQNPGARTLGEGQSTGQVPARSAHEYWQIAHDK